MSPRERAARKLYDMESPKMRFAFSGVTASVSWDEASAEQHAVYFARVDAVLDEIREPTQTVDQAGVNRYREGGASIASIYRAMIDAIKRGEG